MYGCKALAINNKSKATALGDLYASGDSTAQAINNRAEVIGTFNGILFLWKKGMMTDLTTLPPATKGFGIVAATGLNNKGWIVGYGTASLGLSRGFLLKP